MLFSEMGAWGADCEWGKAGYEYVVSNDVRYESSVGGEDVRHAMASLCFALGF